jgi:hypothetical protein
MMTRRFMALTVIVLVLLSLRVQSQTPAVVSINVVILQSPTYPQPQSATTIRDIWQRQTDAFQGFSYRTVTFSNQVLGPFTVTDASLTSCDRASMKAQIGPIPAATKTMYVMPIAVIPGAGTSNTNPAGIVCDRFGSLVLGNEAWGLSGKFGWSLGGMLGLNRAYAEECSRNTTCQIVTPEGHTGDKFDVLATGPGMNALERVRLGWLPTPAVTMVTQPGTYPLTALEMPLDGSPRVLQVPRSSTLVFGTPYVTYWFVELRQVTTTTKTAGTVTATMVTLHRPYYGSGFGAGPTVLEDVDPMSTTTHETVDWVLDSGQVFIDPYTGVSIKTTAITDVSHATIEVLFNQPIPVPPPIISGTKRVRR